MYPQLYLSELMQLSKWKYKVVDNSITLYFLEPFWNWCLKFVPLTIAPNLLTLGNLFVSIGIWLMTEFFYAPAMIPFIIFCYFLTSTLDGLDGKQARKINNSSPIGELFDHTVDIITLFCIVRITTIIYDIHHENLIMVYILAGYFFCYAHYQAHINGYLVLTEFGGPNELLILNFSHLFYSRIFAY